MQDRAYFIDYVLLNDAKEYLYEWGIINWSALDCSIIEALLIDENRWASIGYIFKIMNLAFPLDIQHNYFNDEGGELYLQSNHLKIRGKVN